MLTIYNTKSRRKEVFKPEHEGEVRMYVCGPTVYNFIHIGNARTFIAFDTIRRYLMWRGFKVTFVQNVTDVDDKIITKANEEGCQASDIAERYTQAFIEDMHSACVLDPDVRPKCSEEIDTMLDLIGRLIEKGHAYVQDGDVYFDVRSFNSYGALSGRNIDEMQSGHRVLRAAGQNLEQRKHDELDFALWKAAKPGEPYWESPWGKGRPGWHIECSAMSKKYLDMPFDIHGGGSDLVFPHHENERAQSEAAYDTTFSNYWIHSGMLQINSEKMSKSLGNFKLLRDVLQHTDAKTLRFLMLQTHYRSPLDFSEERLEEARVSLGRIQSTADLLCWAMDNANGTQAICDKEAVERRIEALRASFTEAMDDDFNTSKALGDIFEFVSWVNTLIASKVAAPADVESLQAIYEVLVDLMEVFGVNVAKETEEATYPEAVLEIASSLHIYEGSNTAEAVDALLAARSEARKQKNWGLADSIRDELGAHGLVIEDTPQGPRLIC